MQKECWRITGAKLLTAFLLMLILLCGCGKKLTEGEVYDKAFNPAHSETRIMPLTIFNGKTSTIVMLPYSCHYPDTWVVYIKALRDDKWETAKYYVPQSVYENTEIGSIFRYDKDRDLTELPYTKEELH